MVTRAAIALALLSALAACAPDGETCGLGRCLNGSKCVTLFAGKFTSKASKPGTNIDNLYWCLGDCPKGKSCSGQCMENPIDDTVVVCAGASVKMELQCPTNLGATVDGTCTNAPIRSCAAGPSRCQGGNTCPMGTLGAGAIVGPVGVDVGDSAPLFLDISSLANTQDANPPLSDKLPQDVTVRINVPDTCD